jgi:hypothetical protein
LFCSAHKLEKERVLADLQPRISQEMHCSDWLLVSQQRIDQ